MKTRPSRRVVLPQGGAPPRRVVLLPGVAPPRRAAPAPAARRAVPLAIADRVARREGPPVVPVARPVTGVPVDRAAIVGRDRRAKIVAIEGTAGIVGTVEIGRRVRR